MKKIISLAISAFLLTGGSLALAHCEIPCGIYGDRMRVEELREHFRTIEKSMKEIVKLQTAEEINYNQLVRWVNNKELHADKVQDIIYQYFMNQRIKPAEKSEAKSYDKYVKEITLLHRMLVEAMKTKQTTELSHVKNLRALLDEFEASYFGEEKEEPDPGSGQKEGRQHGHGSGHGPRH